MRLKFGKSFSERVYELNKIVDRLNQEVDVIIVEGVRDEHSLREVGYKGTILRFSKAHGVLNLSRIVQEKYENKRILILTDYDRRGEDLYKKIKNQ